MRFLPFPILFIITVVTLQSCKRDYCKEVYCHNGGEAVAALKECACECNGFYEGKTCETRMTGKFVGAYQGVASCDTNNLPAHDNFIIAESSTEIRGLLLKTGAGDEFYAELISSTGFKIPKQTLNYFYNGIDYSYSLSGNGSIDNKQVTFKLNYNIPGLTNGSCTVRGVKQ